MAPASLAHIEAELAGGAGLHDLLGAKVPPDWPPGEFDTDAFHYFQGLLQQEDAARYDGWLVWYGLLTDAATGEAWVAGAAGYFGPPEGGVVEIGYSVSPALQGRGCAQRMVRFLVDRAFTFPEVARVQAHTYPDNRASINVLLKSGFTQTGQDAESGKLAYAIMR